MADSTQKLIANMTAAMRKRSIIAEQTPARFEKGTLDRIDAALTEGEKRADFIREAVENELQKRESENPKTRKIMKFGVARPFETLLRGGKPIDLEVHFYGDNVKPASTKKRTK